LEQQVVREREKRKGVLISSGRGEEKERSSSDTGWSEDGEENPAREPRPLRWHASRKTGKASEISGSLLLEGEEKGKKTARQSRISVKIPNPPTYGGRKGTPTVSTGPIEIR